MYIICQNYLPVSKKFSKFTSLSKLVVQEESANFCCKGIKRFHNMYFLANFISLSPNTFKIWDNFEK